jgi:hypothetical protein
MKRLKSIEKYLSIYSRYAKEKTLEAEATEDGQARLRVNDFSMLGLSKETDVKVAYNLKDEDLFLRDLFQKLHEIFGSYFKLEETFSLTMTEKKPRTLSEKVFNNKYSSKLKILRLRLEHQIKALYYLSVRMLNLLDWIENKYKKHPSPETKKILIQTKLMKDNIRKIFGDLQSIRNQHEHEKLFDAEDLKTVENIAVYYFAGTVDLQKGERSDDSFKQHLKNEYTKVVKKYTKIMKHNIRSSEKHLDSFLRGLLDVLLDDAVKFYIPYKLNQKPKPTQK